MPIVSVDIQYYGGGAYSVVVRRDTGYGVHPFQATSIITKKEAEIIKAKYLLGVKSPTIKGD